MSYESYIAQRYLRSKKRTGLISFTTFFSFIVITIGVACITSILSILNGFEGIVLDRFLAFDSHVTVSTKGEGRFPAPDKLVKILDSLPFVTGYSPYISAKAVLMSENDQIITTLNGVDVKTVDTVSRFRDKVFYGTNDFTYNFKTAEYGIILGMDTADRLGVTLGDEIVVMSMHGLGRVFQQPNARRFIVTGIFDAGISEYNLLYSYVSLTSMQKFLRMGSDITGIRINAAHIEESSLIVEALSGQVPQNVLVKTWYDMHRNLFASMKLEKWVSFIVLSLMILVASFSIASSIIMLVLEKRKEIGILRSMGSDIPGIRKIFIYNGMFIGVTGTVLGLLLGLGFYYLQAHYQLIPLPPSIYIIDALPVKIDPFDFILVGLVAVLLTFGATLYPAQMAGRLIPSEALRYE